VILNKIAQALRPGGSLILREAAAEDSPLHRQVEFWERFALFSGHTLRGEGLHFQTRDQLITALKAAGFTHYEIKPESGLGSNVLIVASKVKDFLAAQPN